jgi:hypothetical protein
MVIRTPLVPHQLSHLLLTVLLGPLVLRCLGRSYGVLSFFSSSGGSRLTEYLSLGHSNGVCLRHSIGVRLHSLREMAGVL